MAKNTDAGRGRVTWGQYGEALAHLQDSLFIDRDLWVLGNMGSRSLRATGDGSRGSR
jgi:hypothetical protein